MKWPLLVGLLVYLGLLLVRNSQWMFSQSSEPPVRPATATAVDEPSRQTDISDSRLSNFGSDSAPRLDTSELLTIDRVFPLTKTLNKIIDKICRKFGLYVQLQNKHIVFPPNNLNLTFFDNKEGVHKTLLGMEPVVSRLDSIQRLGNAYVAENTDTGLTIIQRIRYPILKYTYDFCDEESKYLGSSSLMLGKNIFLINITLSTSYDNSDCRVSSVDLIFVPDIDSYTLKTNGLNGTAGFYDKLKTVLLSNFKDKVLVDIKQEVLPILSKIVNDAHICSYFDAT